MSLPESTIRTILTSKLKNENFTLVNSQLESLSANGLMGEHLLLVCHIKDNLSANITHNFFVKKKLAVEMENIPHQIFKKEVATTKMFHFINYPNLNKSLPPCYYADHEHLVFEDLNQDGYKIQTAARVASDDELMVILDSVAAIHAGGIAFEEKNKIRLNVQFPDAFTEIHFRNDSEASQSWHSSILKGLKTARRVFRLQKVLKNGKRFEDELELIPKLLKKCEIPSSSKYRNTICQCDLWPGNIFIRRDEEGKPIHCKIIDYQITRYLPPAYDVLDVILLNTSREYRQQENNLLKLKHFYFERFVKYLEEYGVDPERIYSFEEFLESFDEIEVYVKFVVLTTIPILYNPQLTANQLLKSNEKYAALFEDRSFLITHFQENKYLMGRIKGALMDLIEYFERN